jgi:hypothetical protein
MLFSEAEPWPPKITEAVENVVQCCCGRGQTRRKLGVVGLAERGIVENRLWKKRSLRTVHGDSKSVLGAHDVVAVGDQLLRGRLELRCRSEGRCWVVEGVAMEAAGWMCGGVAAWEVLGSGGEDPSHNFIL